MTNELTAVPTIIQTTNTFGRSLLKRLRTANEAEAASPNNDNNIFIIAVEIMRMMS